MKRVLFFLIALSIGGSLTAKEGMWLPHLIAQLNYSEMQRMGLQISAEDIYSVNQSSLKDAVVHFNGGCTGELISSQGLLLTNHHCGYSQIQSHSTLEDNYLKDGFWAASREEELPNSGLYAAIIKEIKDVSNDVLEGTTTEMAEAERDSIIQSNRQSLLAKMKEAYPKLEFELKDFFFGNQYLLISKTIYNDVRLVGAPPSSVGKYGADTDNWVWPRHTGDFSIFRIYADSNNQPADYSADNVPFKPARHLKVNIAGVREGDFTMVYGFPGSTQQYLPAAEVQNTVEHYNPARIAVRDKILMILDEKMRKDEATRLRYASKYARISNSWKRWKGEILGIERTHAIEALRKEERLFEQTCKAIPELQTEQHLVAEMVDLYTKRRPINMERYAYIEVGYFGIEAFRHVLGYGKLVSLAEAGRTEELKAEAERLAKAMEGFKKDYDYDLDLKVAKNILPMYLKAIKTEPGEEVRELQGKDMNEQIEEIAEMFEDAPYFASDFSEKLLKDPAKMAKKIADDDLYELSWEMYDHYFQVLNARNREFELKIEALQARYVRALQRAFPKKPFYPDANSTLRVAYGQVKSYEARDAVIYQSQTHLSGVMEKYIPGDYEFDLPQKLIDLYEKKDYGRYGKDGEMPVCFIATNHTTGGNSGSPVLNARGELIGLNFDRAWDGVMSDMYFDPSICRNVMVDLRYVLFIIDKLGGASYLVDEMDLVTVHPDDQKEVKEDAVESESTETLKKAG
ncbi:S46 family peptidase [Croceimicrobium hydrocarbonivorans]|uniref:Dipeptidyl-peptidase n=1 Tax=Croceimicrobium hydrocarbonivorans TaxID=2761580 RepID=A0A7H0VDS9_9FLAO|nr:S46 family peptidase [Croceimicrobium hydrocarbonivorans]QNR23877.1 S46 family peptidase [Croceimicrobium hydrocarbonivorans]